MASHVLSSLHMFSNFTIVLGKRYTFTLFYSWGNWGFGKLSNLLPNQYILNSDSGYMSPKPLHLSKTLDVESRGQDPLTLIRCVALAKTQLFLTCGELHIPETFRDALRHKKSGEEGAAVPGLEEWFSCDPAFQDWWCPAIDLVVSTGVANLSIIKANANIQIAFGQ